jgi:hypothetical protein
MLSPTVPLLLTVAILLGTEIVPYDPIVLRIVAGELPSLRASKGAETFAKGIHIHGSEKLWNSLTTPSFGHLALNG